MRKLSAATVLAGVLVVLTPTLALAQATLAGVVRDASEAVLPGVTVEVSSPVLIEKVRTATTDGTGQYRLTQLPPGTYSMTVTLTGFTTVKREGVEVTGSGVIAINVAMRVGAVAETITVSGETPVVDTQSARRQAVLSNEVINTLPATRTYGALLSAIPGLQVQGNGSAAITPFMAMFTANGGRANEGRMMIDGLPVAASFNGGGVSTFIYDTPNADEMQVVVSGALGEAENGGPQVNIVPKAGGNTFKGTAFVSDAGKWSTGNNLDGSCPTCTTPAGVISSWDVSGAGGGPIKKDRLWFFAHVRKYQTINPIPGAFANLNAGDATKWTYAQNPNVATRGADSRNIYSLRLTGQVTPRNRVSFSHEYQYRCSGSALTPSGSGCRVPDADWVGVGTLTSSPETFPGYHHFPYNVTQATWSSPLTNKVLLEAGFSRFQYLWAGFGQVPPDGLTSLIPVQEQSAIYGQPNFIYRGLYDPLGFAYADNDANPNNWRATASYVTGAHSMKFGYQGSFQKSAQGRVANSTQLEYRFNNTVANAVSYYLAPRWEQNDRTETTSFFAQDQWTRGRLTMQGGVRFDRAWSWAPADGNGTSLTSRFNPQPISFPETASVKGYNDITPRVGVAYDVFGNGKTAVKVNIGKYLQAATNDENYWANNPAMRTVTSVANRAWTDGNKNFVVDCDLLNPAAQNTLAAGGDNCGPATGAAANFGNTNPNLTTVNPAILQGWGIRPYDWQFGASVQQELLPRVSLEVSYNRRWFGNFFVTDNQLTKASDYNQWTLTAPQNANLPSSGTTATYFDVNPAVGVGARNYQTFETDYAPARTQYWHGVTTSLNARLREGITLQAGTSTGRGVQDTCALDTALPELLTLVVGPTIVNQQFQSCHVDEPWATSFRGLAAYTVPKIDVLVSANIRSVPNANIGMGSNSATNGASRNANYNVPNTAVQQALGRLPNGGLATGNTTVNLLIPGQLYGPRVTQVDMRFAKVLKFHGTRADVGLDLYNLFNTSDQVGFIETYDFATNGATYMQPNSIVAPRFVRFNIRVNF
jgi:hypothetical protein